MTPELPPSTPEPEGAGGEPPLGPEAHAAVEGALAHLQDPDDALRILAMTKEAGAGFAAYLLLPDTNLAAPDIAETFYDTYIDSWERFDQFRDDILEGLGWTDALAAFITQQGIPPGHLEWNNGAVDEHVRQTYDTVLQDGWWHVFYK